MKYVLTGGLQTDNDFHVAIEDFMEKKFCKHIVHDDNWWHIYLETEDPYYVTAFLEELVVAYRCGTHYWLIPELYAMTICIHDCIFDDDINSVHKAIGGNYEGTELMLVKDQSKLPKEHKEGHWTTKRTLQHDGEWYCDVCDYEPTVFEDTPFCPNCGAKMIKDQFNKGGTYGQATHNRN